MLLHTGVDWQAKRVYFFGWHVHHGFVGSVAVVLGSAAMYHDRADVRDWFFPLDKG